MMPASFTCRIVTIDGVSFTLTGWAKHLNLSRQRVHQMCKNGSLEGYVRAKTKPDFDNWKKQRIRGGGMKGLKTRWGV